jgi:hypothetical protein
LLNGILNGLLSKFVFKLKGYDRQAIDENCQVKRKLGFIHAVTQLPSDAEDVFLVKLVRFRVLSRWRAVEKIKMYWPVVNAEA